jgi:hypothetical protein
MYKGFQAPSFEAVNKFIVITHIRNAVFKEPKKYSAVHAYVRRRAPPRPE